MNMEDFENDNQLGVESEEEKSDISDGEVFYICIPN